MPTIKSIFDKLGGKPIVNPMPEGIPPVGAILMIRDDLKFIVKSHLRRNRFIIQRIPEPKVR